MRLKKKCLVFLLLSLVFCCSFSGCSKKNDASYTPDFRIYLMRHGQTVDNATGILAGSGTDSELNEIGVEQAEEAGKALDQLGIHFQAAYSSPLKRAQSTAKLVLACNETDNIQNVTIADDLKDIYWGKAEGQKIDNVRATYGDALDEYLSGQFNDNSENPFEAETKAHFVSRFSDGINEIVDLMEESEANGNVLIVAHCFFLAIFSVS